MIAHEQITDVLLHGKIIRKEITLGGNKKLKIYGTLHCQSGKRMLRKNRVLFNSEQEALQNDYRPCGHCLSEKYKIWKIKNSNGLI